MVVVYVEWMSSELGIESFTLPYLRTATVTTVNEILHVSGDTGFVYSRFTEIGRSPHSFAGP